MGITVYDKDILYNMFDKLGLEGASNEEKLSYSKNIALYKEPKKKATTPKKEMITDFEKQFAGRNRNYLLPSRLSFRFKLDKTEVIDIINQIGERKNIEKAKTTSKEKHPSPYNLFGNLTLNKLLPENTLKKIFINLGEKSK